MHTYIIINADLNLKVIITCDELVDVSLALDELIQREIMSYAEERVS